MHDNKRENYFTASILCLYRERFKGTVTHARDITVKKDPKWVRVMHVNAAVESRVIPIFEWRFISGGKKGTDSALKFRVALAS